MYGSFRIAARGRDPYDISHRWIALLRGLCLGERSCWPNVGARFLECLRQRAKTSPVWCVTATNHWPQVAAQDKGPVHLHICGAQVSEASQCVTPNHPRASPLCIRPPLIIDRHALAASNRPQWPTTTDDSLVATETAKGGTEVSGASSRIERVELGWLNFGR